MVKVGEVRHMWFIVNLQGISMGAPVTMTARRSPARRTWSANSQRQVIMVVIGLAAAARLARGSHTYEHAIMVAIGLAAIAGLGRAGRARSFARLATWDKRRTLSERRAATTGPRPDAR